MPTQKTVRNVRIINVLNLFSAQDCVILTIALPRASNEMLARLLVAAHQECWVDKELNLQHKPNTSYKTVPLQVRNKLYFVVPRGVSKQWRLLEIGENHLNVQSWWIYFRHFYNLFFVNIYSLIIRNKWIIINHLIQQKINERQASLIRILSASVTTPRQFTDVQDWMMIHSSLLASPLFTRLYTLTRRLLVGKLN